MRAPIFYLLKLHKVCKLCIMFLRSVHTQCLHDNFKDGNIQAEAHAY